MGLNGCSFFSERCRGARWPSAAVAWPCSMRLQIRRGDTRRASPRWWVDVGREPATGRWTGAKPFVRARNVLGAERGRVVDGSGRLFSGSWRLHTVDFACRRLPARRLPSVVAGRSLHMPSPQQRVCNSAIADIRVPSPLTCIASTSVQAVFRDSRWPKLRPCERRRGYARDARGGYASIRIAARGNAVYPRALLPHDGRLRRNARHLFPLRSSPG